MTRYLEAKNLEYRYANAAAPLFSGLNFRLHEQSRVGLIGANGAGKSTLIQVLRGHLKPDQGQIIQPQSLNLGYLPQSLASLLPGGSQVIDYLWSAQPELYHLKQVLEKRPKLEEIEAFEALGGYEFEYKAERALSRLGGMNKWFQRPLCQLSGGEQARVGLCYLHLQQPDLLLLDEPGNNLDAEILAEFEVYLYRSQLPFLMISHDRALLDDCVSEIWELKNGQLHMRQGHFSSYKQQSEKEQARLSERYQKIQHKRDQLLDSVRQDKNKAEAMENFKYKRSIKKNGALCKRDDGSGKALREGKVMSSAMAKQSRLNKIEQELNNLRPDKQFQRALQFKQLTRRKSVLISLENLSFYLSRTRKFGPLNLQVCSGDRLAVHAPNGRGKSTLLKLMLQKGQTFYGECRGQVYHHRGLKIAYFTQGGVHLELKQNALSYVQTHVLPQRPDWLANQALMRTEIQSLLACLGLCAFTVQRPLCELSSGEKQRVALAALLAQQADLLILDEPTNHLALPAREALEQALHHYPGALVLVSHDQQFRKNLCERVLEL